MILKPYRLPFDDPHRYLKGPNDGPQFVACIIYQFDDRASRLRPHSVFTAEIGPLRTTWGRISLSPPTYSSEWDFTHSDRDGHDYYHCSGNAAPYVHPFCYARPRLTGQYTHLHRPVPTHRQCAIWWNPKLCTPQTGWFPVRGNAQKLMPLSPRAIRGLGYRILPIPARLDAAGNRDPFNSTHPHAYYPEHGSVEWCKTCKDWITTESWHGCGHFWFSEHASGCTGAIEDPVCNCSTQEECDRQPVAPFP